MQVCVQRNCHQFKAAFFFLSAAPPVFCLSDHKDLQKDVLRNASDLNEVITSTKRFLEENRSKLMPDQIAIIESKLKEAKSKAKLINHRAEESRKDLEKVVTTAIKQESEKVRIQITSICILSKTNLHNSAELK